MCGNPNPSQLPCHFTLIVNVWWYHIGVRIGAYLIILNSEMNPHWPYNICVILLRSMQPFAGLRDSSLPDPCLSATHYGTTEVTINCQSVYGKTEYYSQCGKTIWPQNRIGAYVYHDYRPALQAQSWPPIWSIIVSYHVQSVWIQWTTEFRVTLLLNSVWNSRVGLAGIYDSVARAVSWYRFTAVTVRVNWNKTSILKSLYDIRNYAYLLRHDAASSRPSLPRLPAPWRHQPRPLNVHTRIGQSTPLQPLLRTELQLRNCWIIALIVWRSDWRYKVTFDGGYHCL